MDRATLREHLIAILIKAIGRGDSPEYATAEYAELVLDELVASDDAPEWAGIRVGRDELATVIAVYRTLSPTDARSTA